jgi:exosortase N
MGLDYPFPDAGTIPSIEAFAHNLFKMKLNFTRTSPGKENLLLAMIITLLIAGAAAVFPKGYLLSSNVLIGLCLFPFCFFLNGSERFNFVYFVLVISFALLTAFFHHKIFYFLTILFFITFVVELLKGKVNTLVVFLIAFMSPVFLQVSVTIGFPVRLWLSGLAGNILLAMGANITVDGNAIVSSGETFTVDEACMGLNMLAISLLMGVLVIIHRYRQSGKTLKFLSLLLFFTFLFGLNVISNLFRIIVLVIFRVFPAQPMHDGVGILCMLLYVVVPLYFLSGWFVMKFGAVTPAVSASYVERSRTLRVRMPYAFTLLLAICFAGLGFTIDPEKKEAATAHAEVYLPGFKTDFIHKGITKLSNEELLVYIKPIQQFFTGEHTPLFCWQGSGFEIAKVKTTKVDDSTIYLGTLKRGEESLHTAWWYANGSVVTIDQFEWRSAMLTGEDGFYLVNVTADNEADLLMHCAKLVKHNLAVKASTVHVSGETTSPIRIIPD